jgi:photosystem II stability/assembly factor-like uncharacterized protein
VLRATFGVLLSHDGGETWRWLCEDALGVSSMSSEDPSLALTAGGTLIAGVTAGLAVSSDTGCDWRFVDGGLAGLAGRPVKDVTVRPDNPRVALALAATYDPHAAEGGPGFVQQVYESTDDGANWTALGRPIDPSAVATTFEVAASDRDRLYVSGLRGAAQAASLYVSADKGATWTERPVPLDASRESGVYIAAVDPTNADRVYLRTAGSTSRLLVTDDAGQTYRAPFSLAGQILGFARSPDGSKVYAGNIEQGLFAATRDSLSFQNVSSLPVQCLTAEGMNLWACSRENQTGTGFVAGVSGDDGATFTAKLHLAAQPLLACTADATAARCGGDPQQAYCQLLQGCRFDSGAGPREPPAATKACGCSPIGQREKEAGLASAAAVAALALALRRARRTKR